MAPEVVGLAKRPLLHLAKHALQVRVDGVPPVRVRVPQVLDVLGQVAKQEDVALANLARDFNLPQRQPSSRPVSPPDNLVVGVDDDPDGVDEVDDLLGHPVARRRLAAKDGHARLPLALLGAHGLVAHVAVDDTKDVELLPLVIVYPLDLHVEEGRRVDRDARRCLDVLGQPHLVGVLDLGPLAPEARVVGQGLEPVELCQVLEEAVTAALGRHQLRQTRVGLVQSPPRRDAVGHVGELVGPADLDKVLEDSRLDQVRVQLRHLVDLVRPDDDQVRHAHHLGL